jgi:hypothetical protein
MWFLLGLGIWFTALVTLVGSLAMSARESRREEAQVRKRPVSDFRRARRP